MTTKATDKDVASYLSANPEFFQEHEKLLMKMKLPDNRKGTVSLVERQMDVLRERQRKSRKQLKEFVEAAERNKEIFDKSSRLVLNLVGVRKSSEFFAALETSLKRDFKCKAYSLVVFGKPRQINHFTSRVHKETARGYVAALMRSKEPTLGVLRPEEQDFLFGHQSEKVKSAAVLSVKEGNRRIALLSIGSSDPNYFAAGQDTLFIGFVADAIARLLPRHLPR